MTLRLAFIPLLLAVATLLPACTLSQAVSVATSPDPATAALRLAQGRAQAYARNPDLAVADARRAGTAFKRVLAWFRGEVEEVWGEQETRLPGSRRYVKYTDGYLSRARVDFDLGTVTVETLADERPQEHLREALVTALLTPDDPRAVDLYSAAAVPLGGKPYLLGLVLDDEGREISSEQQAQAYAAQLIPARVQSRRAGGKTIHYLQLSMVANHIEQRAKRYAPLVKRHADRWGVSRSLVYAVIRTESNFNPFAVSAAPAYGLMQLVPASGGRDAYRRVTGRDRVPSRDYLFDAGNNIELGSAYLGLVADRYLRGIDDPVSREFCTIAAYNTGSGNVLKTFHRDRDKALAAINRLSPAQVYQRLRDQLPYAETRRYLGKVVAARRDYAALR